MADDAATAGPGPLPPKLDLRKSGILKSAPVGQPVPVVLPMTQAATPQPTVVPAPVVTPMAAPRTVVPAAPVAPAPLSVAARPSAPPVGASPAARPGGATSIQSTWKARSPGGIGVKPQGPPTGVAPSPFAKAMPAGPVRAQMFQSSPAAGKAPEAAGAAVPAPAPVSVSVPVSAPESATVAAPDAPAPAVAPAPASAALGPTPLRPITKKDTARIPLDAAKPKTVGLSPVEVKPLAVPVAVKITRLAEGAAAEGGPTPSDIVAAEKRKTSRISLESVLSEGGIATEAGGPKTIRLKRPGEGPVARVVAPSKDSGPAEAPAASPTQRRTVVVKRSQDSASARKITVARTGDGADETGSPEIGGEASFLTFPAPHWAYGVIAIAASLVLVVLIYVLASQAIGPSIYQYSYAPGGPSLGMPGKVPLNP